MEVIAGGRAGTGASYLFIAMDVKSFRAFRPLAGFQFLQERLQPRPDLQPPRRPIGRSRLKPLLQKSRTAALPCAVFATANHPPLPTATRLAASLPHAHRPHPLRPHPPVPARAAR